MVFLVSMGGFGVCGFQCLSGFGVVSHTPVLRAFRGRVRAGVRPFGGVASRLGAARVIALSAACGYHSRPLPKGTPWLGCRFRVSPSSASAFVAGGFSLSVVSLVHLWVWCSSISPSSSTSATTSPHIRWRVWVRFSFRWTFAMDVLWLVGGGGWGQLVGLDTHTDLPGGSSNRGGLLGISLHQGRRIRACSSADKQLSEHQKQTL